MLIWITAHSVAFGVLAAFLLLVSSVMSEEVSGTPTLADPLELTTPAIDEQHLMHLPFADKLRNTCDLQNDRTASVAIGGRRVHFELEFLRHILVYVNFTKRSALQVLTNHTITHCPTLHISNLPRTPTLEQLKEMDLGGALNKVYSSLLIHTGYSYFIAHQIASSETGCYEDPQADQRLADLSRDLAEKQRFLACRLQLGMKMLGYTLEDVSSVLNERVSNASQCSLRSLRDCQVMKSISNFLQVLVDYVSDYVGSPPATSDDVNRTVN